MRAFWILPLLMGCGTTMTGREVKRLGREGQVEGVLSAWDTTDQQSVRVAALQALAANPDNDDGRALVIEQARTAESEQVRLAAVDALEAYDGPDVVATLIHVLGDAFPAVRERSRSVLSKKAGSAQEALVESSTRHNNHLVRSASVKVLTKTLDKKDRSGRVRLIKLFADLATKDDAPKVREAAVHGLGQLNAKKVRSVIVELQRTDADAGVRLAAERALAKVGGRSEENALVVAVLPLKNDTGSRAPAMERLGQQIAEYLAARMSEEKVVQVVDREKLETALAEMKKVGVMVYDGDALNIPELGRFKMANQLVYGAVQKQGLVYTLVLNRMDVSTLELVPGGSVTVSGYRSELGQLKVKLADRFIAKFR